MPSKLTQCKKQGLWDYFHLWPRSHKDEFLTKYQLQSFYRLKNIILLAVLTYDWLTNYYSQLNYRYSIGPDASEPWRAGRRLLLRDGLHEVGQDGGEDQDWQVSGWTSGNRPTPWEYELIWINLRYLWIKHFLSPLVFVQPFGDTTWEDPA